MTRDQWLSKFVSLCRRRFRDIGHPLPRKIRVSIGFSSYGMASNVIGECWADHMSTDGTFEIFICPTHETDEAIAATLTHELIHAAVGLDAGHGKAFGDVCQKLGLARPWTRTSPTDTWRKWAHPRMKKLGKFPHAKLNTVRPRAKQGTRNLKAQCDCCGFTFRASNAWLSVAETLQCPDPSCLGEVHVV